MFHHPITKEKLEFVSQDELLAFLQKCNPLMMRDFKEQYKSKYPDYQIFGLGNEVKIEKIKKSR